ncbi:hypothetical protein [Peribacillus loiseleuriae]|uniref:Uncharacterized protein n=1 Tax=Peribacillus loiseleuriae TaxID=1679170 RepID=A0A0K9GYR3_9BACI|nr:hypothetical protein [Peribacillus loiseleuriae]KMY51869.1 hypothetical protein AC625_21995 [Peribacillus loiseleuriae]
MRKSWKIIISLILIILIGGGGTAYYFLKLKTYDVADEKVEKITDAKYDILLPNETGKNDASGMVTEVNKPSTTNNPDTNNIETNVTQSHSKTDDTNHSNGSTQKTNIGSTTNNDTSGTDKKSVNQSTKVTVASIKQKYRPSFEYLQSQANGKVDALVSQAYGEYQTKKKNGESISIPYFYQKYSSASKVLEGNTDAAFHTIFSALQNDLKKNGYSSSEANSFKEEYEATKKARESALLNKVKEAL